MAWAGEGGLKELLSKAARPGAGLEEGDAPYGVTGTAEVGRGLGRPKAAPQKSLAWQQSPWFGSRRWQEGERWAAEAPPCCEHGTHVPGFVLPKVMDRDLRKEGNRKKNNNSTPVHSAAASRWISE